MTHRFVVIAEYNVAARAPSTAPLRGAVPSPVFTGEEKGSSLHNPYKLRQPLRVAAQRFGFAVINDAALV